MKKGILVFLVFSFSLCNAQDTIVMRNGDKIVAKDIEVAKQVYYKNYNDTENTVDSLSSTLISYVQYLNGVKIEMDKPVSKDISKEKQKILTPSYNNPIIISAGIGASFMTVAVPGGGGIFGGGPNFLIISPAYNGTIDYTFKQRLSVGVCIAYQWVTDNPVYGGDNNVGWETEKITRYNFALRLACQFYENENFSFYTGVRIGLSIWTDQIISNTSPQNGVFNTMPTPTVLRGSGQVFFGSRIFLTNNAGIHFELGIGTPYFAEAGITFRIKTIKDKPKK